MSQEVALPQLGMTMKEGIIVAWLKREGESVAKGEPLVHVETDKGVTEIEAPGAGIVSRILVPEGRVVPVGAIIAVLE